MNVINAPCETAKTGAVVKISYQATNRANEWELIDHARKQGVKHLPHVYAYHTFHDLRNSEHSARKRFHDIVSELDQFKGFENRVIRAMVCAKYIPLAVRLTKSPESC